jgi:hypothetical protein
MADGTIFGGVSNNINLQELAIFGRVLGFSALLNQDMNQ